MPNTLRRQPVSTRHALALAFDLAVRRDPLHSLILPAVLRAPWALAVAMLPPLTPGEEEHFPWGVAILAMLGDFLTGLVIGAMLRFRARSVFNTPPEVHPTPITAAYARGLRRIPWLLVTEVARTGLLAIAASCSILPAVLVRLDPATFVEDLSTNLLLLLVAGCLLIPTLFLGFRLAVATESVVLDARDTPAAFQRSFQIMQGRFERWFELIAASAALVLGLALFTTALGLFLPFAAGQVEIVIFWVLVSAFTPIIQYAWTFFYLRLVEIDEPVREVGPWYASAEAGLPSSGAAAPPAGPPDVRSRGGSPAAMLILLLVLGVSLAGPVHAQSPPDATPRLRVFLDCDDCDMPYFQTEVPFVSFVRDRAVADVHLLVTEQRNGGGGSEYTLTFIGRGSFAGVGDTLRLMTRPAETEQQMDSRGAQLMRLGLARYLARTPAGERLTVSEAAGAGAAGAGSGPAHDPWNGWILTTNLNGFFNGQSGTRAIWANGSLGARRVTARAKWSFDLNGSYNENRYDVGGFRYFNTARSQAASARWIFPLGDHWSGAVRGRVWHSTYENIDRRVGFSPAVEYNLFPYTESTRRQLRFEYALRFGRVDYIERTVFQKMAETTVQEELEITLESKEPWGSAELSMNSSHHFHDLGLNRVDVGGEVSLRIVQGLSATLGGRASRIRDQLSLPAAGATPEEVLLQRRQLQTDYSYFVNVGLRFTFGSIFNPAVNARFGND